MSRRDGTTTKVFVGSLPASVTTADLQKLFSPYGTIVECDIANRCGFLHLEDKELAEKAIEELNNTNFMGGRISVERGRVKPPRNRRRDDDREGGGRDRGGPYSRDRNDDYGRSRNGMGGGYSGPGRDYDYDRYSGYDRAPPARSYGSEYGGFSDRRPVYDDRSRDYVDDRRGYSANGYGRSYDERPSYADSRSGYDDRRMPPPYSDGVDDRRPISDHRPLIDAGAPRSLSGFERAPSNDMYSRRGDPPPKAMSGYGERDAAPYGSYGSNAVGGDTYGSGGGYGGTSSSLGYGSSSNTGAYAGGTSYTAEYDGPSSAGGLQSGGHSSGGGGYSSGPGGYSSGGAGYGTGVSNYSGGGGGGYSGGGGGYSGSGGGYASSGGGGYGATGGTASYGSGTAQGGYGDSYGASRGSYEAYSSGQPRSLSSGAGARIRERDPRRGIPSGPDSRY